MTGNKMLQFTNASQLNDPFDCHPKLIDYSKVPSPAFGGWSQEEWLKKKKESDALNVRDNTWLCSLSKVYDSLLMWSHYCCNHTGVCIGLDIDKVLESVPPMFCQIFAEPLVLDVQYKDILERPSEHCTGLDIYSYQWTTKAKEWEYEQEVRLVITKPSPLYCALTPEQVSRSNEIMDWREVHCYLPLKSESFASIYFGVNTDPVEKDKIVNYARNNLNPHINLHQIQVDSNAFKLRSEAI